MALADDFKAAAIQWKIANAQTEKAEAEQRINELGAEVQASILAYGALFIQKQNLPETAVQYRAITSRYGKLYLESLGFRVTHDFNQATIWWGDPTEVDQTVYDFLYPAVQGIPTPTPLSHGAFTGESGENPVPSELGKAKTSSGLLGKLRPKA